jgi:hypothetical protein
MTDLKIGKITGRSGGAAETADETTTFLRKDGVYANPGVVNGVQTLNDGTNTAPSAPVITPTFASGTAAQLADTTRDYMVYFQIGTGGGTVALVIGPTSTPANAILTAAAGVAGEQVSVRLPAGWYLKITVATSTIAGQIAIGC